MSLQPSTRLGPYEIIASIGAGGMGEVYRARDTRLDRIVAVKVLPEHLSSNSQLRERFEREARAISSLSHPHICTLYDVGQQNGIDYLVMEYLEGETLTSRLKKGPLAPDQVLLYAVQVTDALDTAHNHAVVHRDLKPGNIMLTKTGAKLLDFGLAKVRAAEAVAGMTAAPTQTTPLTGEGTILGTLQYMAPEQLEGKEADARTDIFALGAVIYEMATGRKAFEGTSQASLISAIMSADPPPISNLKSMAPPPLDHVVRSCLAKEPEMRWQSAHDVSVELKWIIDADSQAGVPKRVVAHRKRWVLVLSVLLASVSIALSVLAFLHFREKATEVRPFRFSIYAPERAIFRNLNSGGAVAVSPDGRRLVFVAVSEGDTSLWVRSLDSLRAVKLTGTQDAAYPFWSPDSRHIGFFAQGKLKRVEIEGGAPQTLCDAEVGLGGTWNRDGVIIFSGGYTEALSTVPADGGRPTPATALDTQNEYSHRWPIFLPDGRHFAYLTRFGSGGNRVYVGTLGSKVRARLLGVDSNVAYASGYLLFVREGTLFAQPFDAADVRLAGEPFPVAEKMGYNATIGHGAFSVSDNGVLAYYPSSATFDGQLTWFDRSGISVGSLGLPGDYNFLNLSPDETKIVASRRDPQTTFWDIWLFDLSRGAMSRFTSHPSYNVFPIWSPDGTRLIFTSNRDGHYDLYQKALSGASNEQILLKSNTNKFPTDWSSDGGFVTYYELGDRKKMHLTLLSLNSFHKPDPVLEEDVNGTLGQVSPDRQWIAYVSRDTGQSEVYVRSLAAPGGKWQISINGGDQPRWRKDGKELFHVAGGKLMATEVNGNSKTFQVGVTKVLFSFRSHGGSWIGPMYLYAANREGKRFLVNTAVEERAAALPITVVANWTAGLKR